MVCLILVLFALFDVFYQGALLFLSNSSTLALTNLSLVTGLKILIGGVPLLKGSAEIVDKIFNFFVIINGVLLFQLILLKISQLLLIKLLLVGTWALTLFEKTKKWAVKLLILLLFINPGLSLSVHITNYFTQAAQLENGTLIKAHIENIQKEPVNQKSSDKNAQNPAPVKTDQDIKQKSFLTIIAEFLIKTFNKVKNFIVEAFTKAQTFVGESILKLLELAINYFITVILLFVIMPFVYFFLFYWLLNKLFIKEDSKKLKSEEVYFIPGIVRSGRYRGRVRAGFVRLRK